MLHRLYFAKRKPGTGLTPFYYWESYQVASQNPGVCSSRYRAGWIIGRYRMDKVRLIYYGTYLSMTHEYWSLSLVHPFNGELFCRCWSAGWDLQSQSDQDLSLCSGDQPHLVFNRILERHITRVFDLRTRIPTEDN